MSENNTTQIADKTIGELIAEARKNAGLSLRDLAFKIEIHFTYLADIEKNRVIPSEKVIKNISLQPELNLNFDELMSLAGRLGEQVEVYLKNFPQFGRLLRLIANEQPTNDQLIQLTDKLQTNLQEIKTKK
jgi:transcriptional regulator with XRE-family HTH domain